MENPNCSGADRLAEVEAVYPAWHVWEGVIAGVLYAFHVSFVNPETFTVDQSVLIMAMIIIGGTGTVFGPILGALIIHMLPAALTYLTFLPARELASLQQIIYGAAMVLLMIYRPSGLIGRANIKDTWSK